MPPTLFGLRVKVFFYSKTANNILRIDACGISQLVDSADSEDESKELPAGSCVGAFSIRHLRS